MTDSPVAAEPQPINARGCAVDSEHLHEDTMNVGDCAVTLSTYYDGTNRAIRSVIVAHLDAGPSPLEARLVLASFELDSVPGNPDAQDTAEVHRWNANRMAHLLNGDDVDQVEHGDIFRAVLDAALFYTSDPAGRPTTI